MDALLRGYANRTQSKWPQLVLDITEGSKPQARHFFKTLTEWERKESKRRELEIHLQVHYQGRTLDQNRAYHGLKAILAFQRYGQRGWEPMVHEELLTVYGSPHHGPDGKEMITKDGTVVLKRSSEMNTKEMARLIEGVFIELAVEGVPLDQASQYHNWWLEWRQWRGAQKDDPLAYKTVDDKKQRTPYCEACLKPTHSIELHAAHIVSEKASGLTEPWVYLILCVDHHLGTQHTGGWLKLGREFPHLKGTIDKAREQAGVASVAMAGDGMTYETARTIQLVLAGAAILCAFVSMYYAWKAGRHRRRAVRLLRERIRRRSA